MRWKLWGKSEADGRSHHRALCPARPGAVSPVLPVTSVPSSAGRPGAHLEKQERLGSPSGITWCPHGCSRAYVWPAGRREASRCRPTAGLRSRDRAGRGWQGLGDGRAFASGKQEKEGEKGFSALFQAQHFSSHL